MSKSEEGVRGLRLREGEANEIRSETLLLLRAKRGPGEDPDRDLRALGPDKISCAICGDLAPHLHYQVVPKYRVGPSWGEPFALRPPAQRHLPEDAYREIIGAIAAHLPA